MEAPQDRVVVFVVFVKFLNQLQTHNLKTETVVLGPSVSIIDCHLWDKSKKKKKKSRTNLQMTVI